MKKIITAMLVMALLLIGCNKSTVNQKKLQIYASFDVIADFTKKIVGDKADVHTIIESGEEPHDYEISTKQMANFTKADAIIYNGLGMEPWIEKVKENIKNVSMIDTSYGVEVLKGHEHEHEGENHEEHAHEMNPHIWMSIKNAMKQLTNIKDQLIKIDANNKDYYENNYKTYLEKFNTLEQQFATQLKSTKTKTFVVSHAAYTYLASDYGLEEHAISGISPTDEPQLATLTKMSKLIKEEAVKTIFFDQSISSNVSAVLAKEVGVKTKVLYSLEKYEKNEDYISMMQKNLERLVKALNE